MKKAFDANVSRSKPRVRLGALMGSGAGEVATAEETTTLVEAIAQQVAQEHLGAPPDLASVLKARQTSNQEKATAAQALTQALAQPTTDVAAKGHVELPVERALTANAPLAAAEPPAEVVEVQTAPVPAQEREKNMDPEARRERLRERLKSVRENPRPDPLPETVAEAGVLAVERISALQTEIAKARALNLALTQDLESARRQSERATEEARLRMDEARRLATELEGRAALLADLERELAALEGERDEALLSLQDARHGLQAAHEQGEALKAQLASKQAEVDASLAEEERLAQELEAAHDGAATLRRANDALKTERDTLARQVSDLTRERAELLEARKALEAVHRALAKAVAR